MQMPRPEFRLSHSGWRNDSQVILHLELFSQPFAAVFKHRPHHLPPPPPPLDCLPQPRPRRQIHRRGPPPFLGRRGGGGEGRRRRGRASLPRTIIRGDRIRCLKASRRPRSAYLRQNNGTPRDIDGTTGWWLRLVFAAKAV